MGHVVRQLASFSFTICVGSHVWSMLLPQNHINCFLRPEGISMRPSKQGAGTPNNPPLPFLSISSFHFLFLCHKYPWHHTLLPGFVLLIARCVWWTSTSIVLCILFELFELSNVQVVLHTQTQVNVNCYLQLDYCGCLVFVASLILNHHLPKCF